MTITTHSLPSPFFALLMHPKLVANQKNKEASPQLCMRAVGNSEIPGMYF
jgi:hypothetical protein